MDSLSSVLNSFVKKSTRNLGSAQAKSVKFTCKIHSVYLTIGLSTNFLINTLVMHPQTTAMLYAVVHESDEPICLSDFFYPQTQAQHCPSFTICICRYSRMGFAAE